MKLKSLAAAALLACSAGAHAVSGPGSLGTIDNVPVLIGNTVSGFFFDTFSFTIAMPGDLFGSITSLSVPPVLGLANLGVVLQDASLTTVGTSATPSSFSFEGLSAGSYALSVVGFTSGSAGGAYSGVLFAQTIPEPGTYMMLLAGLAAVGFIALRRRSDD